MKPHGFLCSHRQSEVFQQAHPVEEQNLDIHCDAFFCLEGRGICALGNKNRNGVLLQYSQDVLFNIDVGVEGRV